ncbi:MAG: DUF2306 domain-containing protein [Tahibacter sp.]
MILIHIVAGLLALLSGAIALFAAKGSTVHRRSGLVFVAAMLAMTSTAVIIAVFLRPSRVNMMAGTLTFYLVSTALLAVRRTVEQSRRWLIGFMLLAVCVAGYAFALGIETLNSAPGKGAGIPAPMLFMFGTIGLLGALLDARLLWVGSIQGAHRIARHLWRMTFALWIATASFFLGQSKFFSAAIRQSGLLAIPVLLVLILLIYWLARTLVFKRRPHRSETSSVGNGNAGAA